MTSELVDMMDREQETVAEGQDVYTRLAVIAELMHILDPDSKARTLTEEQCADLRQAGDIIARVMTEVYHDTAGHKIRMMKYANEYVSKLKERR